MIQHAAIVVHPLMKEMISVPNAEQKLKTIIQKDVKVEVLKFLRGCCFARPAELK